MHAPVYVLHICDFGEGTGHGRLGFFLEGMSGNTPYSAMLRSAHASPSEPNQQLLIYDSFHAVGGKAVQRPSAAIASHPRLRSAGPVTQRNPRFADSGL
jgi:hypothetical protein